MKNLTTVLLMSVIMPGVCFGASARYTQLVRQKQQKMEQLEKCMGTTKGLKIAGISTLGLTAVGVAGNIYEAKVIKDNDASIEKYDKKIEEVNLEIAEKQRRKAAAQAVVPTDVTAVVATGDIQNDNKLENIVARDIAAISSLIGKPGEKVITHGYLPEQLPSELKNQFARVWIGFIERCRLLIGTNGIKEVSLSAGLKSKYDAAEGTLSKDQVLTDLTEHTIAECTITECDNGSEACKSGTIDTQTQQERCIQRVHDILRTDATGYYKNQTNRKISEWNTKTVDADQTVTFSGQTKECKSGQTYKDCLGDALIKLIASAEIESNLMYETCGIDKSAESSVKITRTGTATAPRTLSDTEKLECHSKIMRKFGVDNVPDEYQSKYNAYLSDLQNRVADKDGYISFKVNTVLASCRQGQKWSQCTNANVILPTIAHRYTQFYAQNEECGDTNNVSIAHIAVVNDEHDCPDGTVWSPSMNRCQTPETAAANAEFERQLRICTAGGATGYSVDRGCLCPNELTHEWNGTRCVAKSTNNTISARCTEEFAGVGEPYHLLNGAEFCTPYQWDSKEAVSAKCREIGMQVCEFWFDEDYKDQTTRWTCSTNCSAIPTTYDEKPDWLKL